MANTFDAVMNNDLSTLKELIDKGASINEVDNQHRRTLLMLAAKMNFIEMAEYLISKEACLNKQNKYGSSALIYCAEKGHHEIAELLIKSGADMNIANNNHKTALMVACSKNNYRIVKLLLENGANTKKQDKRGQTAKRIAIVNKFSSIIQLFDEYTSKEREEEIQQLHDMVYTFQNQTHQRIKTIKQNLLECKETTTKLTTKLDDMEALSNDMHLNNDNDLNSKIENIQKELTNNKQMMVENDILNRIQLIENQMIKFQQQSPKTNGKCKAITIIIMLITLILFIVFGKQFIVTEYPFYTS